MCIRSHNHYVEPLELRNCIVIYITLSLQVLEGLYRLVVKCAYLVMQIRFICTQSVVLPIKPCTSTSSPPTPPGLTWRTLSPMPLGSPWGTSWCMTSFNSTTARRRASVPSYGSLGLAVSTKWNSGWGSYHKWWTGLSLQVVGGAVTSSGGQGCHLKWWAGLSFQKVGGALDLTERTGLSPQVIGVAPSQGVGILSS